MAVGATEGRPWLEEFPVTWRRVVTDPQGFFAEMPETGGLGPPTTFLAICAGANAVGHLLVGWGVRGMIAVFAWQIAGSALLAALLVLVAQHLFHGRAGFEPTFRVVCYAAAPGVFAWLPGIGIIARLYGAYLVLRGIERVQGFDVTHAVLTLLIAIGVVWLLFAASGPIWV